MESALVDQLLDSCSQIRILLVGSSKGKPALIREVFGVNRVLRYPPDYSRDEEVYSDENAYFVVHVFDDWSGVEEVLRRRNRGRDVQPDEVIHLIWHYVDAQDATKLVHDERMQCPIGVVQSGVPIVTLFGRYDNIVKRAAELGTKRRLDQALNDQDEADAAHIRSLRDSINLCMLQYPDNVALGSKDAASKIHFLTLSLSLLKQAEVRTLLIIAQRLEPTVKFEVALSLAMRQFLIGTISTASPLPIPFAGLAGSTSATYLIKQDILRIWNIYDPDFLCAGVQGESTTLDRMLQIPKFGAKYMLKFIPVVAQIRGIWETPRMATALGSLMIDLVLLMERCFLCNMGIETNARIEHLARLPPPPKHDNSFFSLNDDDDDDENGRGPGTPVNEEVRKNRMEFLTGSREGTPVSDRGDDSPAPRKPARPAKPLNLARGGSPSAEIDTPPPKPPRRPGSVASRSDSPSPLVMGTTGGHMEKDVPTPPPKPPRPSTFAATPNIKSPLSNIVLNSHTPSTGVNTVDSTPVPAGRADAKSSQEKEEDEETELLVIHHGGSHSPSPSPPASPAVPAATTNSERSTAKFVNGVTKTPLPSHLAREYRTPITPSATSHGDGKPDNGRPALPKRRNDPSTPSLTGSSARGTSLPVTSTPTPVSAGATEPMALKPKQTNTPLTKRHLDLIAVKYKPVHDCVLNEVEDFFDVQGSGLKRSFQKNTVHRFLEGVVRKYRVTDAVAL